MYNHKLHQQINLNLQKNKIDLAGIDNLFYTRFMANAASLDSLFHELYGQHPLVPVMFEKLIQAICDAYLQRHLTFRLRDEEKGEKGHWFLSNEITGYSVYVDRFCGNLKKLREKLPYFQQLGVNLLHLMPLFQSPLHENDGGYAVSDFRKVDERFGTLEDLKELQQKMAETNMFLMLDIVLNHTSRLHQWALKAKDGEPKFQQYYYMYDDRAIPDHFEQTMPDIFPETAPGSFTYVEECNKWVMTVFHNYQWDLNFTNPEVFLDMMGIIFFYANLGVDILRIDAPAFIWKQPGTTSQNLPQAHTILRLIKQCVQIATPGMALLGEAIVAPSAIMKYFGTGLYTSKECDFAYNATHMALQWDALATSDTKVMLAAQHEILQKPYGTSWITYTRCHDDIGLGYEDYMIQQAGYDPYDHKKFLKEYYSGNYYGSPATGALFSVNPKTQDARISGSLASLCGLEKATQLGDSQETEIAMRKILLMQAHSFFIGGVPMIFYGDELGYTNDYSYLQDPAKDYDNRWMHRPIFNWEKIERIIVEGSVEQVIFSSTQKLIQIRRKLSLVGDYKNLSWIATHNYNVAGYLRTLEEKRLFCIFNFSNRDQPVTWFAFKEHGTAPQYLYDHWSGNNFRVGQDHEQLEMKPYSFYLLEPVERATE